METEMTRAGAMKQSEGVMRLLEQSGIVVKVLYYSWLDVGEVKHHGPGL